MSISREIYDFRAKKDNPLALNRQKSINIGPITFISQGPVYSSSD